QTPTAGLNFNLRVGTTPGGQQIMSPQTDILTGRRRVPKLGNAGPAPLWRLHLLPGTYYSSVQAIDTAFAGSPFAGGASFVVTNRQPVANSQLLVMSEDSLQPITLSGSDPDGQTLNYTIATPPSRGALSGIPPNLTYRPQTNYFGADSFTF